MNMYLLGGYVFAPVRLSVGWFDCQQDFTKTTGGRMGHVPRKDHNIQAEVQDYFF